MYGQIISVVGGIISQTLKGVIPDKNERKKVEASILTDLFKHSGQKLQAAVTVLQTEMGGNTAQRSWRPHLMYLVMFLLFFYAVVVPLLNSWVVPLVNYWIDHEKHDLIPPLDTKKAWDSIPEDLWDLIKLAVGGYVGGRSIEKVASIVTDGKKSRNKFGMDVEL